jgi:hypothetical protein
MIVPLNIMNKYKFRIWVVGMMVISVSFMLSCIPDGQQPVYNVASVQAQVLESYPHPNGFNTIPGLYVPVVLQHFIPIDTLNPQAGYITVNSPVRFANSRGIILFDSLELGYYKLKSPDVYSQTCWVGGFQFDSSPFEIKTIKRYYKKLNYVCSGL